MQTHSTTDFCLSVITVLIYFHVHSYINYFSLLLSKILHISLTMKFVPFEANIISYTIILIALVILQIFILFSQLILLPECYFLKFGDSSLFSMDCTETLNRTFSLLSLNMKSGSTVEE